ncbi:NAD(P)-binding protein [Caulobacter segnis]
MIYDALIVGAGPAGLTAATYLGRFRRKVLVLDGGQPRASWIPESHNTPGFPARGRWRRLARPDARSGRALMAPPSWAREPRRSMRVATSLKSTSPVTAVGRCKGAPCLLATGVMDIKPDLPGIDAAIRRALVRICPIWRRLRGHRPGDRRAGRWPAGGARSDVPAHLFRPRNPAASGRDGRSGPGGAA